MNYAVISSDDNLDYAFYSPFSALFWSLRNFRPILILVGTTEQWLDDPRLRLVLERSREVGAEIHFVNIHGAKTATVAQCARLFAANLPGVQDDDYLLTGDVDMLTLGSWVGGGCDESKGLQLYFSNAYSGGPCPHKTAALGGEDECCPHFPICYVGATARTWREIVDPLLLLHDDTKYSSIIDLGIGGRDLWRRQLEAMVSRAPSDPVLRWNYDEMWLGEKIRAWPGFEGQTQHILRDFRDGQWRLDRSDWRVGDAAWREENLKTLDGVADAHLPRPGYTDEGWVSIRPLFEIALPKKLLAWANDYHEKFVEAL